MGSDPVADSEEEKDENDSEEWIYDANGNRKKVTHCGDCAYKSATRKYVENHVKRMHPNSTTALPTRPPAKCPEKMLLKQCPDCDYSTMSKKEMERHQIHHRTKFANHCTFCSFSADGWHAVSRHAKYYHSNTSPAVASSHHQVYNYTMIPILLFFHLISYYRGTLIILQGKRKKSGTTVRVVNESDINSAATVIIKALGATT